MRDLGAQIFTGEHAEETFGHLTERDVEEMRRQNQAAFNRIREFTLTAQGLLLVEALRKAGR